MPSCSPWNFSAVSCKAICSDTCLSSGERADVWSSWQDVQGLSALQASIRFLPSSKLIWDGLFSYCRRPYDCPWTSLPKQSLETFFIGQSLTPPLSSGSRGTAQSCYRPHCSQGTRNLSRSNIFVHWGCCSPTHGCH